jgi:hypothetical protein
MTCKKLKKWVEAELKMLEPNTWVGTAHEYHDGRISAYRDVLEMIGEK